MSKVAIIAPNNNRDQTNIMKNCETGDQVFFIDLIEEEFSTFVLKL